ncbi:hypothetical protein F8M41_011888 [Gigaspora margarita]|uniref:Uncharacterized protein n=1 Tax=Gigaspora margarita TaxID=4874 RepID=A0A8H4ATE9_GIGMA|nr:hypothetical protein F8M41_011888 [Gigaspora margarita]
MNKLYYNDDLCHKFPEDSLCFSLTSSALEINITKSFCQSSSFSSLIDLNCDDSDIILNYALNVDGPYLIYADAWMDRIINLYVD